MLTIENLPDELIIHFLKFLPDETIKKIMLFVNRRFFNIISCEYLDSLYGKVMRLNAWQEPQFKKFNKAIDVLNSNYQITLFHRPQVRGVGVERFMQGPFNKLYLPFLAIIVILKLYHLVRNFLTTIDFKITWGVLSALAVVLVYSLRLLQENQQINQMNLVFDYTLLRNLAPTQQEKITQFKEQFQLLLEATEAPLNQMNTENVSIKSLKETLCATKEKVNSTREQAVSELQQISRFKNIFYLSAEKTPEKYQTYLSRVNERWSAENPKDSLFELEESDSYEANYKKTP